MKHIIVFTFVKSQEETVIIKMSEKKAVNITNSFFSPVCGLLIHFLF
jgi:hypothetical protein